MPRVRVSRRARTSCLITAHRSLRPVSTNAPFTSLRAVSHDTFLQTGRSRASRFTRRAHNALLAAVSPASAPARTHRRPAFLDTQRPISCPSFVGDRARVAVRSPIVDRPQRTTGAARWARTNNAPTPYTLVLYNNKNDWAELYRRRKAGSASAVDAAHDLHDSSHFVSLHRIAHLAHDRALHITWHFRQEERSFRMDYSRTM